MHSAHAYFILWSSRCHIEILDGVIAEKVMSGFSVRNRDHAKLDYSAAVPSFAGRLAITSFKNRPV